MRTRPGFFVVFAVAATLVSGAARAQSEPQQPGAAEPGYPYQPDQPYAPGQYPQQPQYPPQYPQYPQYPTPPPPAQPQYPQGYYPPPPAYRPAPPVYRPRYLAPRVNPSDPYGLRGVRGYFGVSGFGTFILNQTGGVEELSHGGGYAIFGGLDLGRVVGLELSYTGSYHNPITGCADGYYYTWCDTNHLTLDLLTLSLRLRIPTGTRVQPYFQGGGSLAWIGREGYSADATGAGFEAGGGVDFWLGNHFTLGPRVLYRGIYMSDYAAYTGDNTFISLITADLNLAVRF